MTMPTSPPLPEPWKERPTTHRGVYGVCLRDGAVLAIRKSRGPYTGQWDLPGGTPDAGETPGETLVRELREETGGTVFGAGPWDEFAVCCVRDTANQPVWYEHRGRWCTVELDGIDLGVGGVEDVAEVAWIPLENWAARADLSLALRSVLHLLPAYEAALVAEPDGETDGDSDAARG